VRRYFKEIPSVRTIVCNDFSPEAVESMRRNIQHNGLSCEHDVVPSQGDAK
jgi:tRNA (guanine26-N2/guanine27-N2)-dimethyltransferase